MKYTIPAARVGEEMLVRASGGDWSIAWHRPPSFQAVVVRKYSRRSFLGAAGLHPPFEVQRQLFSQEQVLRGELGT
jgi:hypothetical protein